MATRACLYSMTRGFGLNVSEGRVVTTVLAATPMNRRGELEFVKLQHILVLFYASGASESGLVLGSGHIFVDLSGRGPGGKLLFPGPSNHWNPIDCVARRAYRAYRIPTLWAPDDRYGPPCSAKKLM